MNIREGCDMENIIILRYTNFVDISTISEHKKIFDVKKKVLWGWWKKPFEYLKLDVKSNSWSYFEVLSENHIKTKNISSQVYLCDYDGKKVYLAKYSEIIEHCQLTTEQKELIPQYYRESGNVLFYFLLIDLKEENYSEFEKKYHKKVDFSSSNTMLFVEGKLNNRAKSRSVVELKYPRILHISDLHFGKQCPYKQGTTIKNNQHIDGLCDLFLKLPDEQENIGLIIASGDFVVAKEQKANAKHHNDGFDIASEFLLTLCKKYKLNPKTHLILSAGNHDKGLVLEGDDDSINTLENKTENCYDSAYRNFLLKTIGEREFHYFRSYVVNDSYKLNCVVLDSSDLQSTQTKDYGYVAKRQFAANNFENLGKSKNKTFNIAILHHPLVPPPVIPMIGSYQDQQGKYHCDPLSTIRNSYTVGRWLTDKKVSILLHGHQHYPYCGKFTMGDPLEKESKIFGANVTYISAGSLSMPAALGNFYPTFPKNSFNIYEINLKSRTMSAEVCTFLPDEEPIQKLKLEIFKL